MQAQAEEARRQAEFIGAQTKILEFEHDMKKQSEADAIVHQLLSSLCEYWKHFEYDSVSIGFRDNQGKEKDVRTFSYWIDTSRQLEAVASDQIAARRISFRLLEIEYEFLKDAGIKIREEELYIYPDLLSVFHIMNNIISFKSLVSGQMRVFIAEARIQDAANFIKIFYQESDYQE